MARRTTGQKGVLVSGVLLLVAYFLPWREFANCPDVEGPSGLIVFVECTHQSGLAGIGWAGFLFVIAALLWEAGIISRASMNTGTIPPALIGAALGGAAAIFTLAKFVMALRGDDFGPSLGPGPGAWIGLGLAVILAVSSWLRYRESRAGPAEG